MGCSPARHVHRHSTPCTSTYSWPRPSPTYRCPGSWHRRSGYRILQPCDTASRSIAQAFSEASQKILGYQMSPARQQNPFGFRSTRYSSTSKVIQAIMARLELDHYDHPQRVKWFAQYLTNLWNTCSFTREIQQRRPPSSVLAFWWGHVQLCLDSKGLHKIGLNTCESMPGLTPNRQAGASVEREKGRILTHNGFMRRIRT